VSVAHTREVVGLLQACTLVPMPHTWAGNQGARILQLKLVVNCAVLCAIMASQGLM
jgi:hypothetical protein